MFHLQNITLLQPEHVIAPRLPGGSNTLGPYLQAIQAALTLHYSSGATGGPRTLVLAIGPGGRAQFWLASRDELPSDERLAVEGISTQVAPPTVANGPVILALVYSAGAIPTAQPQLSMPIEWQAVARRVNATLSVDEIVAQLWSAARPAPL
jgi:hypothetical protein